MAHYVKFLHADLVHYDYVYKEGLNCLNEVFNPSGRCEPGGLYFTDFDHVGHWCWGYGYSLVADVVLPPDAQVYAEPCGTKWKCDRFILQNIRPIEALFSEQPQLYLSAVRQNCWALQYIHDQTPELCMVAVQQNGFVLQCVKDQTPEVCLAAVQQNGLALGFVRIQTPELCLAAVQKCGWALQSVKEQTPDICLAAIEQDNAASQFVRIDLPCKNGLLV